MIILRAKHLTNPKARQEATSGTASVIPEKRVTTTQQHMMMKSFTFGCMAAVSLLGFLQTFFSLKGYTSLGRHLSLKTVSFQRVSLRVTPQLTWT